MRAQDSKILSHCLIVKYSLPVQYGYQESLQGAFTACLAVNSVRLVF